MDDMFVVLDTTYKPIYAGQIDREFGKVKRIFGQEQQMDLISLTKEIKTHLFSKGFIVVIK